MNYKWAKEFTLELINQYSMAGAEIPASYNNQADYLRRIPKLLDDAQVYVATGAGKIRAMAALESLPKQNMGEWVLYRLPKDCWQVCSGGLFRTDGPRLQRYHRYHLVGDNGVALPGQVDGTLLLEYYRYPALLGDAPLDEDPLDNTLEAQMALPYYAAAHIVMHDNAFAYASLFNEFEGKLARLGERPHTDLNVVENAYDAGEWEYDR